MEYKKNIFTIEDNIGVIAMNFPSNLNAIDMEMVEELLSILDECEKNPEVKVVVIKSAGKAFSAGGDIGYFYKNIQAGGDINMDDLIEKAGLVSLNIKKMSKMVITSVNGAAAGAGANLALSGDFVVAADNAKFIQASRETAVDTGVIMADANAEMVFRLVGLDEKEQTTLMFHDNWHVNDLGHQIYAESIINSIKNIL